MEIAVTRIYRAMLAGENIAIYGDFDADGITSTALLVEGLKAFNVQAIPYIPHRLNEGHGLKIAALEALITKVSASSSQPIAALPASTR